MVARCLELSYQENLQARFPDSLAKFIQARGGPVEDESCLHPPRTVRQGRPVPKKNGATAEEDAKAEASSAISFSLLLIP